MTPLAVDYENDGRLIRNVTPVAGASGTTSSWGADAEFFWHTDNLHLPFGSGGADAQLYIPRYLSFFTVRNWEKIPTEVVALDDVMKSLDHCALDQLRSCEYTVHAPDSVETATPFTDVAVIERHGSDHFARFDRAATTAGTLPAAEALELWIQTLRHARAQEIILRPGDFLIFDNYRVLHRRRAFQPNSPETSRWLRRCYASRRPTRCRAAGIRNRR
ncbi:TfdA family taurine catabolism dioxygenase TauD [Nocardia tenerifensis]|uniref:TfdA family taurine catabolism dioxygenase TauD n=1 Tax=Nocardia tenerifensis TaxID=228006 RepID=A0A318L0Q2_9NOCA|nr:TfdA family taurine catabolism dioxygenase TauD [Nocardia tenerifensis]